MHTLFHLSSVPALLPDVLVRGDLRDQSEGKKVVCIYEICMKGTDGGLILLLHNRRAGRLKL